MDRQEEEKKGKKRLKLMIIIRGLRVDGFAAAAAAAVLTLKSSELQLD